MTIISVTQTPVEFNITRQTVEVTAQGGQGPVGDDGPVDTTALEALEALDDLPSFTILFENGLI